ncbi:Type I restriction modification enzyme protein S [Phycicoccus elongatus Lp2]|uniref:Type I restriction modification enzyme protein S n=1 Tax=Phycicoccus elongatus Lp2 TaxID=1193181 RepID=N0DYX1_9MICO|nr:restriction endonuclease subunit S [Phycicoccus elongatus]CCH69748.1 Type I restriction modification enzyme protein S [Phycicoccus elongatus Lp2]
MKTAPLGDIAKIVSGATPKTGVAEYWDGEVQWATPADLSKLNGPYISETPRKLTAIGVRSCPTTVLPAGSVLLSSRAPIGHVAINTVPMATNQGFKSLVPGPDLDAKYLYYWLKSKTAYLQSLGNGATFKELSKKTTEQIAVPLPPLPEQRRIAAILDHADALRAKRRQVLTKLDELEQAIFLSMFGHDRELRSVAELCHLVVDCVNRTAPVVENVTPYKMLRTTNIRNGAVDTTNVRYVDQAVFEKWNRRATPRRDDVILTREAPVGEAGVLLSDDKVFLGQRLMLYRVDAAKMTPDYLAACFRSPVLQEQFNRLGSGSTVKHLPLPACRNFQIPVAPMSDQERFSERIASINALRVSLRAQAMSEFGLVGALQSRAFRGEL